MEDWLDKTFDLKESKLYCLEVLPEVNVPEIKHATMDDSEILPPSYVKDTFLSLIVEIKRILWDQIGIRQPYYAAIHQHSVSPILPP